MELCRQHKGMIGNFGDLFNDLFGDISQPEHVPGSGPSGLIETPSQQSAQPKSGEVDPHYQPVPIRAFYMEPITLWQLQNKRRQRFSQAQRQH